MVGQDGFRCTQMQIKRRDGAPQTPNMNKQKLEGGMGGGKHKPLCPRLRRNPCLLLLLLLLLNSDNQSQRDNRTTVPFVLPFCHTVQDLRIGAIVNTAFEKHNVVAGVADGHT